MMDKHDYIGDEERAFIVHTDDDLEDHEENSNSDNKTSGMLREQDRFLPIANIAKVMKRAVPDNAKIAKDARECIQECLSEFVSFITSEASDFCQTEKRKTINGEDILHAMHTLGFDNYVEPLKVYLKKYRETISGQYPNTSKIAPSNPEPADSIQIEIDANDEFTMNLLRNDQGTTYIFGKGENI